MALSIVIQPLIMRSKMISKCYVFIDGLEQSPVICGLFQLDTQKQVGFFNYGQSYLQRTDAFALDPIHLPLQKGVVSTKVNKGVFGVLNDAGPDAWGKKVMQSLHKTKPSNMVEYLVAGTGEGVGCLRFSLSRTASKPKVARNKLDSLEELVQTKDAILNNQSISNEAKKAFEFGQSMGGARPKTLLADQGKLYIVKFNRPDDLFNVVRAEHASMRMCEQLGIKVANTQIKPTTYGDTLLVERFDATAEQINHHFYSANSFFNKAKVTEIDGATDYSYPALAEFIRHRCAEPESATELFKRMVFNALMGNTDDHARNHAFLYSYKTKKWTLSPAYDVTPVNNSRLHGIGLGDQGRVASIDNMLSHCGRFGLSQKTAIKHISDIKAYCQSWPELFRQFADMSEQDIERIKGVIPKFN
jgi:serine/threonine-protein kinase HipA